MPYTIGNFLQTELQPKNEKIVSFSERESFGETNIINANVYVNGQIILYHPLYLCKFVLVTELFQIYAPSFYPVISYC